MTCHVMDALLDDGGRCTSRPTPAALPALDTTATGTAVVLAVAATCVGMGTAKLLLARRLRA